jgi:hypothetical protein
MPHIESSIPQITQYDQVFVRILVLYPQTGDGTPLPRMAEVDMATRAITAPMRKLKFIAWTNTGAFAGVGVAPGSPL